MPMVFLQIRSKFAAPLLVLAVLIVSEPGAVAQETTLAQEARPAVLEALGSDDFATRERATREMLQDESLTPEQRDELFRSAWTPEQVHRLLEIDKHLTLTLVRKKAFMSSEPAAGSIGVMHHTVAPGGAPGLEQPAVEVVSGVMGFPGYAYLQPGDLILAVDGRQVEADANGDSFRKLIQGKREGSLVELRVLREGTVVNVRFELASATALDVTTRQEQQRASGGFGHAWRIRLAELEPLLPKPEVLEIAPRPASPEAD